MKLDTCISLFFLTIARFHQDDDIFCYEFWDLWDSSDFLFHQRCISWFLFPKKQKHLCDPTVIQWVCSYFILDLSKCALPPRHGGTIEHLNIPHFFPVAPLSQSPSDAVMAHAKLSSESFNWAWQPSTLQSAATALSGKTPWLALFLCGDRSLCSWVLNTFTHGKMVSWCFSQRSDSSVQRPDGCNKGSGLPNGFSASLNYLHTNTYAHTLCPDPAIVL